MYAMYKNLKCYTKTKKKCIQHWFNCMPTGINQFQGVQSFNSQNFEKVKHFGHILHASLIIAMSALFINIACPCKFS